VGKYGYKTVVVAIWLSSLLWIAAIVIRMKTTIGGAATVGTVQTRAK
jgi:hypothetical protein